MRGRKLTFQSSLLRLTRPASRPLISLPLCLPMPHTMWTLSHAERRLGIVTDLRLFCKLEADFQGILLFVIYRLISLPSDSHLFLRNNPHFFINQLPFVLCNGQKVNSVTFIYYIIYYIQQSRNWSMAVTSQHPSSSGRTRVMHLSVMTFEKSCSSVLFSYFSSVFLSFSQPR